MKTKKELLMRLVLVCILIFISIYKVQSRNIYVATTGNNSSNGNSTSPYKTIQKAADVAVAGDKVYIKKGTYNETVSIQNNGTSISWITFDAIPGDELQVILNGTFKIIGKSFIRVSGIKAQNALNGFYIEGPAQQVQVKNNATYNTTSSGIASWGIPFGQNPGNYDRLKNIVIDGNKVENACNGGYNECITLANGHVGFVISNNEILNGQNGIKGGEGIDVKEGAKNGKIFGNRIHDLKRQAGIYLDAGGLLGFSIPVLQNIQVYNNSVWSNKAIGAGGGAYSLGTEGNGNLFNIQIYNNVAFDNDQDGVMIFKHPAGSGIIHDIKIINNTFTGNRRYGILLNFPSAYNMTYRNNLCYNNTQADIYFQTGNYTASNNLANTNPQFVNIGSRNFRLNSNSSAKNTGTFTDAPAKDADNNARVGNVDIGAYEYQGTAKLKFNNEGEITDVKEIKGLQIYPNPINIASNLTIELPHEGNGEIQFRDFNGSLVFQYVFTEGGTKNITLPQNMTLGIYLVTISTSESTQTKKIILQ